MLLHPRDARGQLELAPPPGEEDPVETLRRSFIEQHLAWGWPRWRAERAWARRHGGPLRPPEGR